MNDHDDQLWNPDAPADAELARLQHLLGPCGIRTRPLPTPDFAIPHRRRQALRWALAAGIALLLLGGAYEYRLAWTPGGSWNAVRSEGTVTAAETRLSPGQHLDTAAGQSASIAVARIGRITLSPESSLRLLETVAGKHQVALEHGHMRARIWAPPGYFSVRAGDAEVVDLGCDFDLWKNPDGSGRVQVRSGWVSYRIGGDDILVQAGHALDFADGRARTPLRTDASPGFAHAVHTLETAIAANAPRAPAIDAAARGVAETARTEDAFTLLSLLTRWPFLARTALYPTLGAMLGVATDTGHQHAWEAGDQGAMDVWWKQLPRQPKRWWANWKDGLG